MSLSLLPVRTVPGGYGCYPGVHVLFLVAILILRERFVFCYELVMLIFCSIQFVNFTFVWRERERERERERGERERESERERYALCFSRLYV